MRTCNFLSQVHHSDFTSVRWAVGLLYFVPQNHSLSSCTNCKKSHSDKPTSQDLALRSFFTMLSHFSRNFFATSE